VLASATSKSPKGGMGRRLVLVRLHPKHPYLPSPTTTLRRRRPARAAARAHRPMLNCEGRKTESVPDRVQGFRRLSHPGDVSAEKGRGMRAAAASRSFHSRVYTVDGAATVHPELDFPFECWSSLSVWFRNSNCSRCQVRPPNAILGRLGILPRTEYLNRSRHCLSAVQSAR
jgi:hypothetical protein